MIDLYCERTGPGFWGEPLNALTNLAFLLAAVWIWSRARSGTPGPAAPGLALLASLVGAIGIGSFLFHTIATGWARVLDVLPIAAFEVAFLVLYARRVLGWRPGGTALLIAVFAVAVGVTRLAPDLLNGSMTYVPGLAALLTLGAVDYTASRPAPLALLAAGLTFAVSLVVRSLDLDWCASTGSGTHFAWHIGAATVTAIAAGAYARNARP